MKKSHLFSKTAAFALSLSLLAGCNTETKTGQEQREVNDPATKKVVNTDHGIITKRPISATPNDGMQAVSHRNDRYYNNYYGYRPRYSYRSTTPTAPAEPPATPGTTPNPADTTEQPATPNTTSPTPETANVSADSMLMEVVRLTNEQRRRNGLSDLTVDITLANVAQTKAVDMANKGYFSHTSPTYGSPFTMMKSFGVTYTAAGENIAKGQRSAQQVVDDWMNSPGHRANILNANYTHIGVGHTTNQNCWVQMFIRK
ncbi:MAG: CAP domain-containing protein [Ectobacillus sp.]